jgi:hypothetical protein
MLLQWVMTRIGMYIEISMREFPVDCVPQQASGLPPDKDIEKWQ